MNRETDTATPTADKGAEPATQSPETFPDYYANVMKANVTPFDVNLIFGRAAVPPSSPDNTEVPLLSNISTVARVA
ncbi:MAG: hypothetical protein ACREKL_00270, partial [Chthoniobacterales bacterium]